MIGIYIHVSNDCNKMRNTKSKSRRDKALKKAEGRKVLSFLLLYEHFRSILSIQRACNCVCACCVCVCV